MCNVSHDITAKTDVLSEQTYLHIVKVYEQHLSCENISVIIIVMEMNEPNKCSMIMVHEADKMYKKKFTWIEFVLKDKCLSKYKLFGLF